MPLSAPQSTGKKKTRKTKKKKRQVTADVAPVGRAHVVRLTAPSLVLDGQSGEDAEIAQLERDAREEFLRKAAAVSKRSQNSHARTRKYYQHYPARRKPTKAEVEARHVDAKGRKIPALLPVDADFDQEQMRGWHHSRKFHVVRHFCELYGKYPRHWRMTDFVESFRMYFKFTYKLDIDAGKTRKTTWLNSFQSNLSQFRRQLKNRGIQFWLLKFIRMTAKEKRTLEMQKKQRMVDESVGIVRINGPALLEKARRLLFSDDPATLVVALAALTGRRSSELVHSGTFGHPQEKHLHPAYWSHFTGILKQREWDKNKVVAREIPLLAPREEINEALERLRDLWPSDSVQEAGSLYSYPISKATKREFPDVAKLHEFRKTYAVITYEHFNEKDYSLPRFASEVLAHKSLLGGRILTYLNIAVKGVSGMKIY